MNANCENSTKKMENPPNKTVEKLRNFLKEALELNNLPKVAEKSGVHYTTIWKFLRGDTSEIFISNVEKVANALGYDMELRFVRKGVINVSINDTVAV